MTREDDHKSTRKRDPQLHYCCMPNCQGSWVPASDMAHHPRCGEPEAEACGLCGGSGVVSWRDLRPKPCPDCGLEDARVLLWRAINNYVVACGGDPSAATISPEREQAVVSIEDCMEVLHG